mmetsp:Transcript_28434/g.77021  ORF Transcript_28434/g.77021 Transcript_28434/m.77021 type:complete len:110 (+) Transcript_28434:140-469(+)
MNFKLFSTRFSDRNSGSTNLLLIFLGFKKASCLYGSSKILQQILMQMRHVEGGSALLVLSNYQPQCFVMKMCKYPMWRCRETCYSLSIEAPTFKTMKNFSLPGDAQNCV